MLVPTRPVTIRLPDGKEEFGDACLTTKVGDWIDEIRVGFGLQRGSLRRTGRLCDGSVTFGALGEGDLEFDGAVYVQSAQANGEQRRQSLINRLCNFSPFLGMF
jgi:hypothetical protein